MRMKALKFLAAVLPFVVLATVAGSSAGSAQGGTDHVDKVDITLNYVATGPHAGFMYARQLGYYHDAGLEVTLTEGRGSGNTSQVVGSGRADFGYADAGAAMQVRAKGGQLTIVAPILQTNAFAIVSLKKTGITNVRDLIGKKVAAQPGSGQAALLDAVFNANDIDKTKVNLVNISVTAFVGSLLQGQVDAILAGADSEAIQLQDRGVEISQLYFRDIGVPTVGLSILVNDAYLKAHADVVRRFVAASLKGWAAARQNPEAAATAITAQFPAGANTQQFLKQLNVDLRFLCSKNATALGKLPADGWTQTFALLTKYTGLPAQPPVNTYYSDDYLPANPPACEH
jgi:NitT/TauT family transport system substrate-binding protein